MSTAAETARTTAAARAIGLSKVYGAGDARVVALDDVDVAFAAGQFVAIMGPSGSGKSTLMHCLAGLDTPTTGRAFIGDTDITALSDKALTRLRRDQVGFIFQSFNLLPTLSALENITLPADIAGRSPNPAWLDQIIDTVDLRSRLGHRPAELSGGQQQRVACARALAGRPAVIFADEPTGNLDSRTAADVLALLRRCVHELGQTIVMVSQDPVAAAYADRAVFLVDGRIVDDSGPRRPARPCRRTALQLAAAEPFDRPRLAGAMRAQSYTRIGAVTTLLRCSHYEPTAKFWHGMSLSLS